MAVAATNIMAVKRLTHLRSTLLLLSLMAFRASAESFPKVEAYFQDHCTELSPCHQICKNMEKGGYVCDCHPGYHLHTNGFSCEEDEPEENDAGFGISEKSKPLPPKDKAHKLTYDTGLDTPSEGGIKEPSWEELFKSKGLDAMDMMMGDAPADPAMDTDSNIIDGDDDSKNESGKEKRKKDRERNRERERTREKQRGKGRRRKTKNRTNRHRYSDMNGELADALPPQPAPYDNMDDNEEANNLIVEDIKGPVKFRTCDELRCHAGGRCVPDDMRGGVRCQCHLGNAGEFCEQDIVVQYPKFMGTGYMAFPVLRGAYKEFTITVEFRPETGNGLLLFSGEHPTARSDFFSISLIDGHAEFRFDCGTGMAQITTINQVQIGGWNRITVHRNDYNGWIQLNDGPQAKGRARGLYTRITFREDLYLGGYKNNTFVGIRTGMQWGFVGCIRYMEVNGRIYDMRKGAFVGDAIHGIDVGECSSHVCDTVKCHNGGTCLADSPDTHVCLCPLGTAGDRCEHRIDIHVPSFSGASYLQYIGLRRTVLSFTEIEIVFKALDKTGMILYNGYTSDRSGDFISLGLVDGYLEYRFDLGTGPAIIRSRGPISLNEWHVVRVSRTGRDGYMQIDNQASIEGMSKGAYTQLTLTLDLFIGGHRNYDEVAKHAGIRQSFKGCIQKVVVNERPLKLLEEAINGVNVDNCNHPCVGQPCLNGGRCIPIRDIYKCSCPLGFENTNCEDRKARRELTKPIRIPEFKDSFLLYTSPYIMQRVRGKKIDVTIRFKTRGSDGLLFWTGEKNMTSSSDYLALGLVDGHIQFGYNLGSGEVVITYNETKVDDGMWHKVHAQRYENVGYLEVDNTDTIIEGTSPGNLKQLNTQTKLYIGGMEDITLGTLKKYTQSFDGCISNVTLAMSYPIDMIGEASRGQNVKQCTGEKVDSNTLHHKKDSKKKGE